MHVILPALPLYVAPLCPAGHLPRKGGDHSLRCPAVLAAWKTDRDGEENKLPTCGGDVRQDRGGRRRARLGEAFR